MRVEIAEQLAVCAMNACTVHLTKEEGGVQVQRDGMYAKVASFGTSLVTLGLIPTAMAFEKDKEKESKNDHKKEGNYRVNQAVYLTLKTFTESENLSDLWKPDPRLTELLRKHDTLLALYRQLKTAADYALIKEYSILACASLKLALNTFPDPTKQKTVKGSDKHDG